MSDTWHIRAIVAGLALACCTTARASDVTFDSGTILTLSGNNNVNLTTILDGGQVQVLSGAGVGGSIDNQSAGYIAPGSGGAPVLPGCSTWA